MVVLAATLLIAVAKCHAFLQGNKRTAFSAAAVFLGLNGYALAGLDDDGFGALIEAVVASERSEADLLDEFARRLT